MLPPNEYNSSNFSRNEALNEILNNRVVILRDHNYSITLGNEKVARRYRSPSIRPYRLHQHYILFKGIRTTFPRILLQTPKEHHCHYHNDRQRTDINYRFYYLIMV